MATERYDLDEAYPGLVREITANVGALTMARYRPSAYGHGGEELRRESSLSALLQSAALKRFESCWWSCLLTVERMIAAHEVFLAAWDAGQVLSGEALREAAAEDLDETALAGWIAESLDEADVEPVEDYRPEYREDVSADLSRLKAVRAALRKLRAEGDPKLALLRRLLTEVPSQKVVVFLVLRRHRALPRRTSAGELRRPGAGDGDRSRDRPRRADSDVGPLLPGDGGAPRLRATRRGGWTYC